MTPRGADAPEVFRITGAPRSHSDDLDQRINRYLFSMAVRTACVVLVFVVHGPLRWVFAVGAVFLPYVAVLLANATDRRRGGPLPMVDHRGLAAGPTAPDAATPPPAPASAPRPRSGQAAASAAAADRVILEGRLVTGHRRGPEPHP